jgi:hypothetical protein
MNVAEAQKAGVCRLPWVPCSQHIDGSRQCPLGTYGDSAVDVIPGATPEHMEWVSTYQADNNLWPSSEPAILREGKTHRGLWWDDG